MALLLFYFILAIGFSFLCSVLEAVLLSMTPSYVASRSREGRWIGRKMEELKRDPDKPLAAILSLNTIAHTVGAVGVGAQAQVVFQQVPISVISAVLTLLILVLSEIIPKTIGATYWRAFATPSTYLTYVLTVLLWPLVALSRLISRLLTPAEGMPRLSRDEISSIADLGFDEGVIDRAEQKALRNLLQFRFQTVDSILTPRVVTVALSADSTIAEVMEKYPEVPYSRLPVFGDSNDEILGYVIKQDILKAAARDEHQTRVRELMREVMIVPESARISPLFQQFLKTREHMAVVVDEYGSFSGVVTLEDVVETLIGQEIMDESDEIADLRSWAAKHREPQG